MDVVLDGLFHNNSTYDYDEDYENHEEFESKGSKAVLIQVFYSLEFIVGLLGNGLVLAALAQRRRSWRISDTFILQLSVVDLLLLVTLPILAAQESQQCGWCFTGVLCKISAAVINFNFYCGILLMVLISLDRFLAIVHATPLFSPKRPILVPISCLLVWISSLTLTSPDWIFMAAEKNPQNVALCAPQYFQSQTDWKLMSRLVRHTLGFLLPAVTLVICWSCVLLRLQRSARVLRKQRSVMVMLSLVAVFILCWTPYNIALILDTVRSSSKGSKVGSSTSGDAEGSLPTVLMVTSALGCIHACLRPLLYFGLCSNFRKWVLCLFGGAAAESESSLWGLGVNKEALPEKSREAKELKQMTCVHHQAPSTHW